MRTTHTFATLEVSGAAWREIADKLKEAGYDHAFIQQPEGMVIDMHGIGLIAARSEATATEREADAKHFLAWVESRGDKLKFPSIDYVWHAACAYARRTPLAGSVPAEKDVTP